MKPHQRVITLLVLLLAVPLALASDPDDACGAMLCLAGEMTGSSGGGECSRYLERYFRIVEKPHGDFSPARTARKRLDFLEQCRSGDSDTRQQVNERYGTRLGL